MEYPKDIERSLLKEINITSSSIEKGSGNLTDSTVTQNLIHTTFKFIKHNPVASKQMSFVHF